MSLTRWSRIVAVLVAVGALVYFYFEPLRLSVLVVAGRSPHCPLSQAIDSTENLRRLMEAKDRILEASRLVATEPNGLRLWETPKGRYWIPEGNDYILPFNLAEQERAIYSLGEITVRKGDVVLDCGANVGVYTRTALEAGARLVVAIEPAPENIECLRRNLSREITEGRVVVYPKGVWDKDDALSLHVDPANAGAASFLIQQEDWGAIENVPLTTIDKLVEEVNLNRVDFIKMDIEGAEVKAIRGGRKTLALYHPRLAVSAYHAPDHPEAIPAAVRAAWHGYRMKCGVCSEAQGYLRPDVLLFY